MPRPDRSEELQQLRSRNKKPNRKPLYLGGGIAALATCVGVYAISSGDSGSSISAGNATTPKYASSDASGIKPYKGIKLASNAKHVDVFEDFQCPSCHDLETKSGAELKKLASSGKVDVTYHIMDFLDERFGNKSSRLAANAAFCAANDDKFIDLHDIIYKNQPKQEGTGYTAYQLQDWGKKVGLKDANFNKCMTTGTYNNYVDASENYAMKQQIASTPTVRIDGKTMGDAQRGGLMNGTTTWAKVLGVSN